MTMHRFFRGALLLGASAVSLPALASGGPPSSLGVCAVPGTVGEHLAQGDRFDYDPQGLALSRVKGHYNVSNDKLLWTEQPAADSYLTETKVKGDVTVSADGIDVHATSVATEDNGTVRATEVEQTFVEGENGACTLAQWSRPAGTEDWFYHQGTLEGGIYTYGQERLSRRSGGKIWLEGERYADSSFSESYESDCDGGADCYEYWWGDADGNTSVYWEQNWGDAYIWGTEGDYRDGSKSRYVRWVWEWCVPHFSVNVDYAGNGSGNGTVCDIVLVEYEPGELWEEAVYIPCAVTVTNGTCTQTCDNGAVSSCDSLL